MIRPIAVLFSLLLSSCAHRSAVLNDVDAAIEQHLAGGVPSIAVAIAKNGRIVHEAAYAFADSGVPATVHTPYPLASVTKPLVATGVMVLSERKALDLDAPVKNAPYTVRQLLNHTSGLPTYATILWEGEPEPKHDVDERYRRYGFSAHPPGVVSEYSNLGYGILGQLIAEKSGQSLAAFLEREVFRPLGMNDAIMVESGEAPPGGARKYDMAGKPLPLTRNDTPGAGNIYASVHDLVRFGMFHLDDRSSHVLSNASKELMRSYVEPGALYPYYNSSRYGLGWYFRTTANGTRVVWHEGGMPGASSLLVLLPEHELAAAVLINANDRNDVAQAIANQLIESVEPSMQPLTFDPIEGFAAYDAQAAFLGTWEGTLTLDGKAQPCTMTFETDGKITVKYPNHESTFKALVNGDLLLGTFAATLAAEDVAKQFDGYVLVRLVRRGDQLNGTMIAYAAPDGLRHLYPFPVKMRRRP